MSSVKKAFVPFIALITSTLETNPKARLSEISDQLVELASAKSGAGGGKATTFHRAEDGTVIGIYDYYFKKWFDPRVVEFSPKKSSASGYNSMSKEGTSNWTKQNSAYKKAKEDLLEQVGKGEVAPDQIADRLAALETEKQAVIAQKDGYGFDSVEELVADSQNRGLSV